MKKKIYDFLIIVFFVAGGGLLLYPAASNLWNQYQQDKVIDGYERVVGGYSKEELEAMREEARLYNADLLKDEIIIDPFTQVKDRKAGIRYYDTLDPYGNGVMGTVKIPKIDVELPIFHGTSEEVLQEAIGHLEQTSLPIGGKGTHAVVSGHRGLPSAKLFTDLNLLEVGDKFYMEVLEETMAYQVDQILVVEPSDLEALAIDSGKDYVTLVTCTPYAINTHRLLVRGTRIPYTEKEEAELKESVSEDVADLLPYIITVIVIVVLLLIIWRVVKRKKKTKRSRRK